MSERRPLTSPPSKALVTTKDGTMSLPWLNWLSGVSGWIARVRVASGAIDVPSIAAGGTHRQDVSFPGAAVGDFALASLDPMSGDLSITAQVSAADVVTVRVVNHGAGAVDLAAGTLRVRVEKAR